MYSMKGWWTKCMQVNKIVYYYDYGLGIFKMYLFVKYVSLYLFLRMVEYYFN